MRVHHVADLWSKTEIVFACAGSLVLSGSNSYSGSTYVNGGSSMQGAWGSLSAASSYSTASGTILECHLCGRHESFKDCHNGL
ncbi:hypothetical protein [Ochrobactrum pituitosum]|uniref:hypothetical protein n=1 Tax=Brucella pituitosa TaxID=571256 RepID=UPI0009A2259E